MEVFIRRFRNYPYKTMGQTGITMKISGIALMEKLTGTSQLLIAQDTVSARVDVSKSKSAQIPCILRHCPEDTAGDIVHE